MSNIKIKVLAPVKTPNKITIEVVLISYDEFTFFDRRTLHRELGMD